MCIGKDYDSNCHRCHFLPADARGGLALLQERGKLPSILFLDERDSGGAARIVSGDRKEKLALTMHVNMEVCWGARLVTTPSSETVFV